MSSVFLNSLQSGIQSGGGDAHVSYCAGGGMENKYSDQKPGRGLAHGLKGWSAARGASGRSGTVPGFQARARVRSAATAGVWALRSV